MTTEDSPIISTPQGYSGPAAPWALRGAMYVSIWRVPLRDLPPPAAGARILSLAGHALVMTAWANYAPGGTLTYNEFLFAVGVRGAGGLGPACTVGPIWVDDEIAAVGGRHLWGIPKRLGVFGATPAADWPGAAQGRATLTEQGVPVAALEFQPRRGMPLPVRMSLWTVQDGQSGPLRTRCSLLGRLRLGSARWNFGEHGPLAFLRGRSPLASACLEEMSARFGV